jgi:hypothetical protein
MAERSAFNFCIQHWWLECADSQMRSTFYSMRAIRRSRVGLKNGVKVLKTSVLIRFTEVKMFVQWHKGYFKARNFYVTKPNMM